MKQYPILFSPLMVRAILAGDKTQTRRNVTIQQRDKSLRESQKLYSDNPVLWVRERWRPLVNCITQKEGIDFYADMPELFHSQYKHKWKSPLFLKHKDARIYLQVTDVKVQELQSITEEEAILEGVGSGFKMKEGYPDYAYVGNGICVKSVDTAVKSYATLWDLIHGRGKWDRNPTVWVIEFKRIEKPKA